MRRLRADYAAISGPQVSDFSIPGVYMSVRGLCADYAQTMRRLCADSAMSAPGLRFQYPRCVSTCAQTTRRRRVDYAQTIYAAISVSKVCDFSVTGVYVSVRRLCADYSVDSDRLQSQSSEFVVVVAETRGRVATTANSL